MKDLFKEIKETSINKFSKSIEVTEDMIDDHKELQLIHLLNEVEHATLNAKSILKNILVEYDKKLIKSDFQNLGKALLGDVLELESRFYGVDKRTVELKVFVRRMEKSGKSTKIVRAIYTFQAEYKGKTAA